MGAHQRRLGVGRMREGHQGWQGQQWQQGQGWQAGIFYGVLGWSGIRRYGGISQSYINYDAEPQVKSLR